MKEFGQVVAILDAKRLIVRVNESEIDRDLEDSNYRIFARRALKGLENLGLSSVDLPKGRVQFTAKQAKDLWLAEVFNLSDGKHQLEPQLSAFDRLRLAAERGMYSSNTSFQCVPEPPKDSALLDKSQAVGLKLSETIQVGDLVAEWD